MSFKVIACSIICMLLFNYKMKYLKVLFSLFFFFTAKTLSAQTTFEIQKVKDFAKLYGTVRYFHPSDEASAIDWKSFAVHGIKEIAKAKNQEEFKIKLKELFLPIAPSLSFEGNYYKWTELYPVYWIHNGLGIDTKSHNMYYSERFNKTRSNFGLKSLALMHNLKINEGRLKFTYEAQTDGGNAHGYIALMATNGERITYTADGDARVTTNEWTKKELITTQFNDLGSIIIGLFSEGGESKFRNIKLFLQDKNKSWREVSLPPLSDSNWFAEPKGDYIVKENEEVTILDIAKSKQLHSEEKDNLPDNYHILELSNHTSVIIPVIVYADEEHTLPVADPKSLIHLQKKIKSVNKQDFNIEIALANIVISWNVFRHFYPYQDEIDIDWESILHNSLKDAYNDTSKQKHKLTLEKLTEKLRDAHIDVNNNELDIPFDSIFSTQVSFKRVGEDIVVKDLFKGYTGKLKKGDIINKINNIAADTYIDSVSQYISGNKQWKYNKAIRRLTNGAQGSLLTIETAKEKEVQLIRNVPYIVNRDFYESVPLDRFREISEAIFYINLMKLSDTELDSLIPVINRYEGLIIDLRGYPKDVRHRLFSYIPFEDTSKWLCNLKIQQPFFSNTEENCKSYSLNKIKLEAELKTKNVLLINEKTISNAELFAQLVKHYKIATIIGCPTAGANGNINRVQLLSDFTILFTGMKIKNPDGTQFHSIGVTPDVFVKESAKDIRDGKDKFIEQAIEILNN